MVDIEVLKSIPHCSGLSAAEIQDLRQFMFERTISRGEIVLLDGEPADALYFVVSGVLKVFKTSADGKEQILSIALPRQSLNDAPVLDGRPNYVSAQAMTPALLYGIRAADLRRVVKEYPAVLTNMSRVLAGQLRQMVALVEDLSFKNVLGRVARILLEPAGGDGARPRLTQQDMAAMAGTAREMVGRSLKALESDGIIRLERHRIIIANKNALLEIARRG